MPSIYKYKGPMCLQVDNYMCAPLCHSISLWSIIVNCVFNTFLKSCWILLYTFFYWQILHFSLCSLQIRQIANKAKLFIIIKIKPFINNMKYILKFYYQLYYLISDPRKIVFSSSQSVSFSLSKNIYIINSYFLEKIDILSYITYIR